MLEVPEYEFFWQRMLNSPRKQISSCALCVHGGLHE